MNRFAVGIAIVGALLVTGCGGDDGGPTDGTPTPSVVVIEIDGFAFVGPDGGDEVTVAVGDTIEWVNRDAVEHTVTSSSAPAGGDGFDSGPLARGSTFRFIPDTRGTWVYLCEIHPLQMRDARIIVQ